MQGIFELRFLLGTLSNISFPLLSHSILAAGFGAYEAFFTTTWEVTLWCVAFALRRSRRKFAFI
jgi:hypothetical protein